MNVEQLKKAISEAFEKAAEEVAEKILEECPRREIKFRAWDDKDKFWYPAETMIDFFDYLSEEFAVIAGWFNKEAISLEQYTGLKDKNGKEIYEGDIVANGTLTGVVEYRVDDFCAWTVGTTTNGVVLLSGSWSIIGNIHENPELLKGEE